MTITKFFIRPIVNARQGNEIFAQFQREHPEYFDFAVSVAPDSTYGYFMTVSYKVNE